MERGLTIWKIVLETLNFMGLWVFFVCLFISLLGNFI